MFKNFAPRLLHPRNAVKWFALAVLWLLVQLPYPLLHVLGTSVGKASRRFLKRREQIATRNIELCFPNMDAAEREKLIEQNFMSLGSCRCALYVTGTGWSCDGAVSSNDGDLSSA